MLLRRLFTQFTLMIAPVLLAVATVLGATACDPDETTPDPTPSEFPAPDASALGPNATTSSDYRFEAEQDDEVVEGVETEVWARVYRPTQLGPSKHPLIVMLHGNHNTCAAQLDSDENSSCQYTFIGSCPAGQQVVQNHLGYAYLAERLASWGYVVVSINANLGITCGNPVTDQDEGMILARGALVLKHLALLSQWNSAGGTPASLGFELKNTLDFSQVGYLGHSRGGPGMRAAYTLYQDAGSPWPARIDPDLKVRGIFEIAPTDGQTARTLNAVGTAWNVLLPTCDGDVDDFAGLRPYDRMLSATNESPATPKSMFAVWGANHNAYNTQWQASDSSGCVSGTSPIWTREDGPRLQRDTALGSVMPFFRAHVGPDRDPKFALNFDPRFGLPAIVSDVAPVERAFVASPSASSVFRAETFQGVDGIGSQGLAHTTAGVSFDHGIAPQHDASHRALRVEWSKGGADVFFQGNWPSTDLSDRATLDLRVSREANALNSSESTDFDIQLVFDDGTLGPAVAVSDLITLSGPSGQNSSNLHSVLRSVRIPLVDLGEPKRVRGVRFTFNSTGKGVLYFADIGFTRLGADPWPIEADATLADGMVGANAEEATGSAGSALGSQPASGKRSTVSKLGIVHRHAKIARIQLVTPAAAAPGAPASFAYREIEVESTRQFPVRDALPVLLLDGKKAAVGRFSQDGDLRRMTFRVPVTAWTKLPARPAARIVHQDSPNGESWDLGAIER